MLLDKRISCLLLVAVVLLSSSPAFGQVKKGFKYLDKEKWPAAALAFAADTGNVEVRPVAFFGLASVLSNPANPQHDYVAAMRFQEMTRQEWKLLKPAQRNELTKQYEISTASLDKLKSILAGTAWKEMEKTATLPQVDAFVAAFAGSRSANLSKALQKQALLVKAAISSAATYADYHQLSNYHRGDLPPATLEIVDRKAFDLFLQEKGVDWLGQFYAENPQHPLTRDAGRTGFSEAWNSEELTPLLDFLAEYPKSKFAPSIRLKMAELLKTQPLTDSLRAELTSAEKVVLGEAELAASGKMIDPDDPFDPKDNDAWLAFVQKLAPDDRAYNALEKMTQHYLWKRDWPAASKALHAGQSLFPEQKDWFDQLIPMVDAPGTGIKAVAVSDNINAGGSEYIPVPTVDGKTLYFCAVNRTENEDGEDVFMSTWSDSSWSKPKLVQELSGNGNQAPVSLTEGDSRIILFNEMRPYQADKTPTGWTKPVPVEVDVSQFYWVGLVQIAANGQVLFLEIRTTNSSDIDIYVCRRTENGTWGKPTRVDGLCTDRNDRSPYLHPDMHTMYFSSNGKAGMGGLDVYRATALDDTWLHWSTPVNLGKEINTMGDDWGYKITTDGKIAWFATRTASQAQDIFYVEVPVDMRPQEVKQAEFYLIDDQKKPMTNATVIMEAQKTGKKVGSYRPDPATGKVVIPVPNDQIYTIHIEKEGYISKSEPIPVQKPGQPLLIKPTLRPVSVQKMVETGQTLALNLLFDYDKAVLHAESLPELHRIAEQANRNKLRLNVVGYTDNAGDPAYNLDLSKRRAEAAKQALVEMGIPAAQINADGFGEQKPVVPNDTDEHRAQNRRVEVQFVH